MNAPDPHVPWRRWLDHLRARMPAPRGGDVGGAAAVPAPAIATDAIRTDDDSGAVAPAAGNSATASQTELDEGDLLGVWRLRRRLGSGGMGAVYLAERADGYFQQQAAIKLIHGQAGRAAFAHFARERQILATLQHPHIARLLDGGATPGGQPYLVMEYVEGVPIDVYCRERALDLGARLRLFRDVCAAVQFAHQRLIVHCDLKPSNVLVRADGTPVLLDFGIARALDHQDAPVPAEAAYFTPGYASPEQLRGEAPTTASDVHALGLILFELISGRQARAGADDRTITLLGHAAVRPSQLAEAVPWRGRLHGDLDAIVLQASAAHAGERYASALALSNDVQRFCEHRPVLARPQTLAYRGARLLRRRWGLALAALLGVLLLGVFTWRLAAERDRAREAEREARTQAEAAGEVSDFLVSVFNVANPGVGKDRGASAREVLDQGAARIESELADTPRLKARLLDVLATAYRRLGEPPRSVELFRHAIELYLDPRVNQPLEAAQALSQLAEVYANNGFPPREAVQAAQRSLALRQQYAAADALALADSWNTLGLALDSNGDYPAAEAALDKALTLRRGGAGAESLATAAVLDNLAVVAGHRGDDQRALAHHEQALALNRRLGGEHTPAYQVSLQGYAVALARTGQGERALTLLEKNLKLCRELYADASSHVALAHDDLGSALQDLGRYADAAAHYREAMHIDATVSGPDSVAYAALLDHLASTDEDMGDYAQAIALFGQSLAIRRKTRTDDDAMVLRARQHLARALTEAGRLAEARPQFDAALAGFRAHNGENNVSVAQSELVQARWLLRAGQLDAASRTIDRLQASGARFSPLMQAQRDARVADLAAARNDAARALAHRQAAWDTMRRAFGDTHPQTAQFALAYAAALREVGRTADARAIVAPLREMIRTTFAAAAPVRQQLERWP